jgi:hypothetical protein
MFLRPMMMISNSLKVGKFVRKLNKTKNLEFFSHLRELFAKLI